jgi:Flagellar transcriptional activator (FlhC)
MEVALRMIRFEARSCTIRACTGLTDDRIRKLFNVYVRPHSQGVIRRRGRSPQQAGYFTQSVAAQRAASVLASVFTNCGLLGPATTSAMRKEDFGALLCDAYEFYLELDPCASLSFEHAWFLLKALRSKEELAVDLCLGCSALHVFERWVARNGDCPLNRALNRQKCRNKPRRTPTHCS